MLSNLTGQIAQSCAVVVFALSLVVAARAAPPDGQLLKSVERQNRLIADKVRAEVDHEVQQSRAQMAADPAGVEQTLKLLLERVLRTPQLDAASRATMRGQLEAVVREANRRAATKEVADREVAAARAASLAQRRIAGAIERGQERARQLMDRFQSLMDEGRYAEAGTLAASPLRDAAGDDPLAETAALVARQRGAAADNLAQRAARQMKVVATLAPVESALVPFPDDEPYVYPEATAWEELTLRHRGRNYDDLARPSRAEAKIRQELNEPTAVDFMETPLEGVVEFLKDLHGIEIQLDTRTLEAAGVRGDTPVSGRIKDISLRSALRHLLRPLELTYVVKDEAIVITTTDQASREMVTRVYPVGDLVVPIANRAMGPGVGIVGNGPNSPGNRPSQPMNNLGPGMPGMGPGVNPAGQPGGFF